VIVYLVRLLGGMRFRFMIAGMAKQSGIFLDNKKARALCVQSEDTSYKIAFN